MTKKRIFLTITLGFAVIFLSQIIMAVVGFIYFSSNGLSAVAEYTIKPDTHPLRIFNLVFGAASIVFAGFLTGQRVKEKGWLYAALAGLIWILFTITLSLLIELLPRELIYGPDYSIEELNMKSEKKINALIASMPLNFIRMMVLAALGGLMADYLRVKKVKS